MLFPVDLLSPATEGMMATQTTLAYKAVLRNDHGWIMPLTEVFYTHTQSHTAVATPIYCVPISHPSLSFS